MAEERLSQDTLIMGDIGEPQLSQRSDPHDDVVEDTENGMQDDVIVETLPFDLEELQQTEEMETVAHLEKEERDLFGSPPEPVDALEDHHVLILGEAFGMFEIGATGFMVLEDLPYLLSWLRIPMDSEITECVYHKWYATNPNFPSDVIDFSDFLKMYAELRNAAEKIRLRNIDVLDKASDRLKKREGDTQGESGAASSAAAAPPPEKMQKTTENGDEVARIYTRPVGSARRPYPNEATIIAEIKSRIPDTAGIDSELLMFFRLRPKPTFPEAPEKLKQKIDAIM